MGHDRTCIAVLDNDTSTSRRLIESSAGISTKMFSNIGSLVAAQPTEEEFTSIFVDTDFVTQTAIAEDIHRIKEAWPMSPLIALTNNKNAEHLAELFRVGFDEFLLKPLNGEELAIRMKVKRLQLGKEKERAVSAGGVSVDPATRSIKNLETGKTKYLSPIEVNLLSILLGSMGQSISRENVKRKCWGNTSVSDNALNRKLFEVRRALNQIGSDLTIKTLYGSGYAIQKKKPGSTEEPLT